MDPILAAHIAARADRVRAQFPEIDHGHYIDVVLQARAARYAAHLAAMTITPDMVQWGIAMSRRFGPYVQMWNYVADWFTALLIMRYGEEERAYDAAEVEAAKAEGREAQCSTDPQHAGWPLAFTDADRQRAMELLDGKKWPAEAFTILERDPISLAAEG